MFFHVCSALIVAALAVSAAVSPKGNGNLTVDISPDCDLPTRHAICTNLLAVRSYTARLDDAVEQLPMTHDSSKVVEFYTELVLNLQEGASRNKNMPGFSDEEISVLVDLIVFTAAEIEDLCTDLIKQRPSILGMFVDEDIDYPENLVIFEDFIMSYYNNFYFLSPDGKPKDEIAEVLNGLADALESLLQAYDAPQ